MRMRQNIFCNLMQTEKKALGGYGKCEAEPSCFFLNRKHKHKSPSTCQFFNHFLMISYTSG